MNLNKNKLFAAALALVCVLACVSCDNFFGSSWGKERDYDPANINLSVGNLDEWVKASVGRPALAAAITIKIKDKAANATGAEKAVYQIAGAKIAVEASGVSQLLLDKGLGAISDLMKDSSDPEASMKKIMNDIFDGFRSGGGPAAAKDLTDLLAGGLSGNNPPAFSSIFKPEPGDAAEAVMVLTLDLLAQKNKTVDDLIANPTNLLGLLGLGTSAGKITGTATSTEAQVLGAYVNYIATTSGNPVADAIKKALTTG